MVDNATDVDPTSSFGNFDDTADPSPAQDDNADSSTETEDYDEEALIGSLTSSLDDDSDDGSDADFDDDTEYSQDDDDPGDDPGDDDEAEDDDAGEEGDEDEEDEEDEDREENADDDEERWQKSLKGKTAKRFKELTAKLREQEPQAVFGKRVMDAQQKLNIDDKSMSDWINVIFSIQADSGSPDKLAAHARLFRAYADKLEGKEPQPYRPQLPIPARIKQQVEEGLLTEEEAQDAAYEMAKELGHLPKETNPVRDFLGEEQDQQSDASTINPQVTAENDRLLRSIQEKHPKDWKQIFQGMRAQLKGYGNVPQHLLVQLTKDAYQLVLSKQTARRPAAASKSQKATRKPRRKSKKDTPDLNELVRHLSR